MNYNWNWHIFWDQSVEGTGTYAHTLLLGLYATLEVSFWATLIALVAGTLVGVARTLPSPWARRLSGAYVEFFRNIPLLVQLFVWFFVLPELLPGTLGLKLKQLPNSAFYTAIFGLGFYMSARVAEQLRAGINSMPRGQRLAATALGLTTRQTYSYILLPMAFRIILPPLTSELLNTIKNSSVALTIGLTELTQAARNMDSYTFNTFEAFTGATIIYLVLNLVVTSAMRFLERSVAVPGYIASK